MKRVILPIVLIVLGATLLIGCFYVPVTPHPTETSGQGKLLDSIGENNSAKPLRVGQVTRDQILKVAPVPWQASADGKSLVYYISGVQGYWVWPLCFQSSPENQEFAIRLNFDDGGTLRSYSIIQGYEKIQKSFCDLEALRDLRTGMPNKPWPPPLPATRPRQALRNGSRD